MRNGDRIPETGDRKGEGFSPASGLPSPISRGLVVSTARSYLGTPFHHQGRLKGVGVDCVGLIVCVLRDLGREVNDSFDYNGHPDSAFLREKLREHFNEIAPDAAREGDIFLFRIGRNPQHLAFSMASGQIIHTHQGVQRVVETHIGEWRERIVAAFEIPGIEV